MPRKRKAEQLHDEGMALSDAGQDDQALEKYFRALELDIERPTTHYNIGLIYKYRSQWRESFHYNQRARELNPTDEAANWNLAIAATALRDWRTARHVWHALGLPIEEGDDIIADDFGIAPIRLNPDTDGEVVWAQRIDPVRARINSVPLPESGFRYADVVLHDGAAVGYRIYQERRYPVFNVLEMFERSPYSTYHAEVRVARIEDLAELESACARRGLGFEDWTTSVRMLCKQCSEGIPHEHDDKEALEARIKERYRIGLASTDEQSVREVLSEWEASERSVVQLECVLAA